MKLTDFKSDGLGGFIGVTNTIGLGCRKRILSKKFHILIVVLLFNIYHCNYHDACMSVIMALQRSNETYRNIKFPYTRIKITKSNKNILFCRNLFFSVFSLAVTWMFILVLLSGDVEPNPGPDSVVDNINSSHNGSLEMLTNHLSILHLNIQSLLPKLDLIAAESEAYDLIIISESWLKPEIRSDSISLTNFHSPFRRDRCDRPGGGVVIYVRDNIYCKRRSDLELQGLEAVWIELSIKSKKLFKGGCYRPPNSNAAYFDLLSESIDRAYNTNIIDIFILGDFQLQPSE